MPTQTAVQHRRATPASPVRTVELHIQGMTCRACEQRISSAVGKVPGVVDVAVSARRGQARVRTRGAVSAKALHAAVRTAGYELGRESRPWFSRDRKVWRDVALAVVGLVGLAVLLDLTGARSLAEQGSSLAGSGSLAVIVLVGVAAGFSTCMALVGGLVLAISARFAEQHRDLTRRQRLRPQIAFNVGRVVGFGIFGAGLGAVGSLVALNGAALALVIVGVSVVMGLVGLRLTQISPRLSSTALLTLPSGLGARFGIGGSGGRYDDRRAALLGAATFLLPCGFTQAVQVYALSTGSPWRAGVIMALFALGTLPGLLGIGSLTALVAGRTAATFFRVAGVAVLVLAAINATGSARILAPSLFSASPAAAITSEQRDGTAGGEVSSNVTVVGGVQTLRTTQVAQGYEPAHSTVLAGVPVTWEIDSQALTCAASLYAPDLGIDYMGLEPGVNTLTFTLEQPGTYTFSCAMGMYGGTITAVEP